MSASNTGSDPTKYDTDNDTFSDVEEIAALTDPNNKENYPKIPEPGLYFSFEGSTTSVLDRTLNGNNVNSNTPSSMFVSGAPAGSTPGQALDLKHVLDINQQQILPRFNNIPLHVNSFTFKEVVGNDDWDARNDSSEGIISAWIKPEISTEIT